MLSCRRDKENSLFVLSFEAGSEAGLALVTAPNDRAAEKILKSFGKYNSTPSAYTILQCRALGLTGYLREEVLMESYVNALTAYEAIVAAANKLQGLSGVDGKSAYMIAVEHGFVGTEEEWLESLHGSADLTKELIITILEYVPADQEDIHRLMSLLQEKADKSSLRWIEGEAPSATKLKASGQHAYGFGSVSNAAWSEEGTGRAETSVSYHYNGDIEFSGNRMRIFPTKNYIDGTEIYSLDYPIYPVARDVVEVNNKPFRVIVPNVEYEVGDPEYYDVNLSNINGSPVNLSDEPASGWVVLIKDGAIGPATHVEGIATTARNEGQYAGGWYNDPSNANSIHTIGCGTDDEHRANAFDIHKSGKVYVKGVGSYNGTNASSTNDLATVINGINSVTFYAAWDGRNRPFVGHIPDCVTIEYQGQTYQGTLTPANANPGTFYLVRASSDENDLYDEYVVTTYGFGKVWEKVGSRIDMSGYVSPYMIEVTKDDNALTVDPEVTLETVEAAIQDGKLLYIDLEEDGQHLYYVADYQITEGGIAVMGVTGALNALVTLTIVFGGSEATAFFVQGELVTSDEKTAWNGKQAALVSGENIKTINNESILGSGNIQIQGGDPNAVKYTEQTLTDAQKTQARTNIGAGTYSKPSGGIPASDLASGVIPTVESMTAQETATAVASAWTTVMGS